MKTTQNTRLIGLKGEIIGPESDKYDQSRRVWNGMVDKRPNVIVRAANTEDVALAIRYAVDNGLPLAIRGGGHNVAGTAVNDGGLVIDLSLMKSTKVDAERQIVHAGAGVLLGELDAATQQFGLAVPMGVVSETGIAGLTLGGGIGWLRRKHGLSCDALIAAEVVTANGRVIEATEHQNQELLWALRGGGGNFGVVTRFTYRAHPVGPDVAMSFVIYPWDRAHQLVARYHQICEDAPDEITALMSLGRVPPMEEIPEEHHGEMMVAIIAAHAGDPEEGTRALQPLRSMGEPIVDFSDTMRYVDLQQILDEDYPQGMRYYWKSSFLDTLGPNAIDELIHHTETMPSPLSTVDIWQLGGQVARVGATDTAFGSRDAKYILGIEANWTDAEDDDPNVEWARNVVRTSRQFETRGTYLNFAGFHEHPEDMVKRIYGSNQERLQSIKRTYDPENVFQGNLNLRPG